MNAELFIQWKNTDACYDFYCSCHPDEPQHFDGYFGDHFICGSGGWDESVDGPEPAWCGSRWAFPVTFAVVGSAGGVRPREIKSAPETRRGAGARVRKVREKPDRMNEG